LLAIDASEVWTTSGVAPTADITDVTPDPSVNAVDEIEIVFSEPVTGLDITDLTLELDSGAVAFGGTETLTTTDNITWTLGGLAALTVVDGTYLLTLTAAGSDIQDAAANALASDATDTWIKYTPTGGWVAFNDHIAGPGTHVNTTSYAGNGTASGQLKNIDTGVNVGVVLTTSDSGAVYDNNGESPAVGTDAHNIFNTYVDFTASTGTSIEIAGTNSYTHAFSSLDIGDAYTYDFDGTMIRGNAAYNDRWTTVTLVGADASVANHSAGSGVVVISPTQVAILVGSNIDEGVVAGWTGIDPGADGEFQIVSTHYTGATPGVGTGTAVGNKTYAIGGIRLAEVQVVQAPVAPPVTAPLPAAAPGDEGFVAYNDHIPSYGGATHANTTDYSAMSGEVASGLLKNIADGTDTTVTLTVTDAGIHYAGGAGDPAAGTDAYNIFNGYVDLGAATGGSIEVSGADHYTYTFSGLDIGDLVTYNFDGTAVRANSAYANRWTLVTLQGADGFLASHSTGIGVVTSDVNPALGVNQVAIWTGHNSTGVQGFVAGWTEIDPGADGVFTVVSEQYQGVTPGVGTGDSSGGDKGYGITGIRLEEVAPSGPQSWLKRVGDTDADTGDNFRRSASDSKGVQNPDMTVPFGSVLPTEQGIGFSDNQAEFDSIIATDVGDTMQGVNASLFSRIEFASGPLDAYDTLTLRMKYDDGFIAYLNGTEVARRNADNPLAWNTEASGQRDNTQAVIFEEIDISAHLDKVIDGVNVLAIHSMNVTAGDADLIMQTELLASRGELDPGLSLEAGLNRVTVEAFSGPDGTGELLDSTHIDIWNDVGPTHVYPQAGGGGVSAPVSAKLVVRDSYLPGVPVLVRVEALDATGEICRDLWDATVTLSADSGVQMDVSAITMYNGMGSVLVTFTGGTGDFQLTASVDGLPLQDADDLTVLDPASATSISGDLSLIDAGGVSNWSGIYHVTGDLLVPDGHTLNVAAGTLVLIDGNPTLLSTDGVDIDIQGVINSQGTEAQPVTFTAFDSAAKWGEMHHDGSEASTYSYTNITLAGHSPRGGHTNTGPALRSGGGSIITFDHSSITDLGGKVGQINDSELVFQDTLLSRAAMGPEFDHSGLLFQDSFIIDMLGQYREDGITDDDDGIYLHAAGAGQTIELIRSVIAHGEDDGVDTASSTVLVKDTIIRDYTDKGISVSGGDTTVEHAIIVGNNIGMEVKSGGATGIVNNSTVVDNVNGLRLLSSASALTVNSSIVHGTSDSLYADIPAAAVVTYSNIGETWAGTGNINEDPMFVDPAAGDYSLQADSLSIDAGDPADPLDTNGSTIDQGYYTNQPYLTGPVTGELAGDTIWSPENGQYRITGDLTVPAGITLTIMPGTTVFFGQGAQLIVEGRLAAEGLPEANVYFAPAPNVTDWEGIHFVNTTADNRITHAILQGSTRTDGMVELDNSRATIENSVFENADRRRITAINSSLIVRNSTFADFDVSGTPENNVLEHIWGRNVIAGGEMIIENNVFGVTPGHNDAIDFDAGHRLSGDPVPQILNNTFNGGGDDALDIEGDFYVQGNVFKHYRKDAYHAAVDSGESNVISAGDTHNVGHHYVVTGNVFYDCDHVTLVKESSFMTFTNNTVVGVDQGAHANSIGAINFDLAAGEPEGRGAYLDGNIFVNTPLVFNYLDTGAVATDLTVNRSILPAGEHYGGAGNIDADARLTDPAGGDFTLKSGSPAFGSGPVGVDMGADVAPGASVSPVPLTETYLTDATFDVSGDGDYHHAPFLAYKYRLNGGAWSAEQAPGTQIVLTGLVDGPQSLEVISQNFAGVWQVETEAVTRLWLVDTALSRVLINEVLATNRTAHMHDARSLDVIELYNDSLATVADLSGWSISDNVDLPQKFVFPAGTTIAPGAYLTLYAGDPDPLVAVTGIHLGFQLDGDGDDVSLYNASQTLVDSITFGTQIADMSIGRTGATRDWSLTHPTIGAANIAQATVDPDLVLINEWFANGDEVLIDDFIELHNPDTLPADISGIYVTDNPANQKTKHQLAPLSFIDAEGFVALTADSRNDAGHVDFRLRTDMEILGLFDSNVV
jgi:hypothetical protein